MLKVLTLTLIASMAWSADPDPNGFFKDREWAVEAGKGKKVVAQSKYLGEPVQRPNRVVANLDCGQGKILPVFTKKYCGINYMKVVAGKLEVMFLDYSSKDSRGYCTKKRVKMFDLPACPNSKKKK
jgi:hypothetical protein